MIGGVILTHTKLASDFKNAIEFILGEQPSLYAVDLDPGETMETIRLRIDQAVAQVDEGDGVLMFVDLFGGAPANVACAYLEPGRVEILTGVNLPMLIRFIASRAETPALAALASLCGDYGRKNISIASEIMSQTRD